MSCFVDGVVLLFDISLHQEATCSTHSEFVLLWSSYRAASGMPCFVDGVASTKIGCGEGGCGACTVVLSFVDPISGEFKCVVLCFRV